jgi:translation initiation factor 3 subunit L
MLMSAKGAARKFTWVEGGLLEGQVVGVSDINFGVDEVRLSPSSITCRAILRKLTIMLILGTTDE